jgi:hypothetical protein
VYSDVQGAEKLSLMLAHMRADVHELNTRARTILRQWGKLGTEIKVGVVREVTEPDGSITVERGERRFAAGDRMFLRNYRDLGSETSCVRPNASQHVRSAETSKRSKALNDKRHSESAINLII